MGLSATTSQRSYSAVHKLHRVEKQGNWSFQDRGPSWSRKIVGHSEEPPFDELR